MEIITAPELTADEKENIAALLKACYAKEPLTLTFPTEEADLYLLACENGRLLSAAAFLEEEEELFECTAFTRPDCRRRGIFCTLLERGISLLPEDTEILFYTDRQSADALEALTALGAEFLRDEYMMELPSGALESIGAQPKTGPGPRENCLAPGKDASLRVEERWEGNQKILFFSGFHGSLNISLYGSHYYLYDFQVQESFRGQGFGRRLLLKTLSWLSKKEPLPVRLQVSGSNVPALALYKKTGFGIAETLSCYLY